MKCLECGAELKSSFAPCNCDGFDDDPFDEDCILDDEDWEKL